MSEPIKKILIVKTSALGDIIHAFPSIPYLKNKFPDAQIDWVVEKSFAELVRAHPDIHQVFCVDTKNWRKGLFSLVVWKEIIAFRKSIRQENYDAIFDLQGNLKSGFFVLQARGKAKVGFGWKTVHEQPNLLFTRIRFDFPHGKNIREDNLYLIQKYFEDFTSEATERVKLLLNSDQQKRFNEVINSNPHQLMVCPGSFWLNKQLPEDTLLSFLQMIHKEFPCFFLFAWGNQEEFVVVSKLHEHFKTSSCLLPKLPIPVLQNLMG